MVFNWRCVGLLWVVAVCGCASSQSRWPVGVVKEPTPSSVDSLSTLLYKADTTGAGRDWSNVLKSYFGEAYTANLPDLVVFAPALHHDTIGRAIMYQGKTRDILHGEKQLYVVVFSDIDQNEYSSFNPQYSICELPSSARDTAHGGSVVIHRSSEDYRPSPLLHRAIDTFGGALGGVASKPEKAGVKDTSFVAPLVPLGEGAKGDMYVAFAKVQLAVDAWERVSVCPGYHWAIPHVRGLVVNFANTAASRFSYGLAVGVAWQVPDNFPVNADTIPTDTAADMRRLIGKDERTNLIAYGTWYPPFLHNRPALPPALIFGLTFGTSIAPDGLFKQLVGAVAFEYPPVGQLQFGASLFPMGGRGFFVPYLGFGITL